MDTHPRTRIARRLALTLVAALAFVACGDGGESDDDEPTETAGPTGSATSTEKSADLRWYRNPADVREAGVRSTSGRVAEPDGNSCETHPTNLVVYTPEGLDDALLTEVDAILEEYLPGPDPAPEELVSDVLWMFSVGDSNDRSEPLEVARALNDPSSGLGDVLRASPDYRMFPMPAWIYFPGNLPGPADDPDEALVAMETHTQDSGQGRAPRIHVIDTGLVHGLDLHKHIDGEPDNRGLGDQAAVAGHGTFIAGVVRQHSDAPITHWAVPDPDVVPDPYAVPTPEGRPEQGGFYESDVFDAALRLRDKDDPRTITNLSLGTVVCDHGSLHPEEDGGRAPDVEYPLLSLQTIDHLTMNDSVVLAAAGNTAGLKALNSQEPPVVYPAAFTAQVARQSCGSEQASDGACEVIDKLRETVARRLMAVGATDQAGDAQQPYAATGDYVTVRDLPGCHTSTFLPGSLEYTAVESKKNVYPRVQLTFEDATPNEEDSGSYSMADWCGTSFATGVASALFAEQLQELGENETASAEVFSTLGWPQGP
ncbi:S8/S53 family peptidase [Salsipaludibacter albus]|uniref:S8/S53 family peptidase n=1 Tax=Salsipaludibacter albus TaxID=2849650 RepID=UPI001EE4EAE4|nr:S8/S53 family peptidase [Salsipaludibacter albus]MBY5163467.1 S8/S53 family peptidase [Salsipaludibacter albus]